MSTEQAKIIKIGITGDSNWSDINVIKRLLYDMMERWGKDSFKIVTCGQKNGADILVKKIALKFNLNYQEIPISHQPYTLYSIMPKKWHNRKYSNRNVFVQLKVYSKYCDCFVYLDSSRRYSFYDSARYDHLLINKAQKNIKFIKENVG